MSEVNFTKGDWVAVFNDTLDEWHIEANCCVNGFFDMPCAEIGSEEDAHLIAAAPEMYRMLERILANQAIGSPLALEINQLLADARGE